MLDTMSSKNKDIQNVIDRMVNDKSLPGPGWYDLIIKCNNRLSILDPEYKILQIKEKFGGLRYYYQTSTPYISSLEAMKRYVSQAEEFSLKICELCGEPGTLINHNSVLKTRCVNCINEKEDKNSEE